MTRFLLACILAACGSTATVNAQTNPTTAPAATDTVELPVYSMRMLELREGVPAEQFEAFVKNGFAKVFAKPAHGVHPRIVKADRGVAKGKYMLLVVFASEDVRDKYFPVEDGEPAPALREDVTPEQVQAVEKLGRFVKFNEYADFVAMGEWRHSSLRFGWGTNFLHHLGTST